MLRTALTVIATIVALLLALIVYNLFAPGAPRPAFSEHAYSDFVHDVEGGTVQGVVVEGAVLTGVMGNGSRFQTILAGDPALVPQLVQKGVRVTIRPPLEDSGSPLRYALNWLPFLLYTGGLVWAVVRVTRALAVVAASVKALPGALAGRPPP